LLLRAGLLAAASSLFVLLALQATPLSLDPALWYFPRTLLTLSLLALLGLHAFRSALGRHSALPTLRLAAVDAGQ